MTPTEKANVMKNFTLGFIIASLFVTHPTTRAFMRGVKTGINKACDDIMIKQFQDQLNLN